MKLTFTDIIIKVGAYFFLLLGVVTIWGYISDIGTINFADEAEKNRAEIVIGFTGIFFTASSIFFVIDNLRKQRQTIELQTSAINKQEVAIEQQERALMQQKEAIDLQRVEIRLQTEEMKQANETAKIQMGAISLQQAETTFFNVLNNHKELIKSIRTNKVGFEGLSETVDSFKRFIEVYHRCIITRHFERFETTGYHPGILFARHEDLGSLVESIALAIDIIKTKLNDEKIYHDILLNNLNNNEKFIFGLALKNQIVNISGISERYTSIYEQAVNYDEKTEGRFPWLNLRVADTYETTYATTEEFDTAMLQFNIDFLGSALAFKGKSIKAVFTNKDTNDEIISGTANWSSLNMNFIELFRKELKEIVRFKGGQSIISIRVYFSFILDYQGTEFTVLMPKNFIIENRANRFALFFNT